MVKKKTIEKEVINNNEMPDNEIKTNSQEVENKDNYAVKDTDHDDKMNNKNVKKSNKTADHKFKELNEKLKAKEEKIEELQDKYLRLSAEFDNYRKRTLKEKIDLTKYAGEEILKDLLPIIDDFERGLNNINDSGDINTIKEGFVLINNKIKTFLNQKGIKEIDALHQDFNMDMHEAVTKIQVEDEKLKGKIVDVIEKGYYLNDKVIRYAKVVIGE
jgi:molecular chaperone GrpE